MIFGLECLDRLFERPVAGAQRDIVERRYPVEGPEIVEMGLIFVAPPRQVTGGIAIFEPARAGLEQPRAARRSADTGVDARDAGTIGDRIDIEPAKVPARDGIEQ